LKLSPAGLEEGAATVAGEGFDFVRSLAQEKSLPDFLFGGYCCVDGGAVCASSRTSEDLRGVSGSE